MLRRIRRTENLEYGLRSEARSGAPAARLTNKTVPRRFFAAFWKTRIAHPAQIVAFNTAERWLRDVTVLQGRERIPSMPVSQMLARVATASANDRTVRVHAVWFLS